MAIINLFRGDYRFLSNFYVTDIPYEGLIYPSVEHAFQAAKSTNLSIRETIRCAETPAVAKRIGRLLTIREDWENVKCDIMLTLLRLKFNKEDLKIKLLSTEDAELIEGNCWGDIFWGQCNGQGQNILGVLLMKVRKEIKADSC